MKTIKKVNGKNLVKWTEILNDGNGSVDSYQWYSEAAKSNHRTLATELKLEAMDRYIKHGSCGIIREYGDIDSIDWNYVSDTLTYDAWMAS